MINLDYNATTPILDVAQEAMTDCPQGNSHSIHTHGLLAKLAEKEVEKKLLDYMGNPGGRIIWTSSGSEANRLAIEGLTGRLKGNLVTTGVEHKSIETLWRSCGNAVWPRYNGFVATKDFQPYVDKHTSLISMMLVNNETGVIMPLRELKKRFPNVLIHTDAVQALGKLHINPNILGVDLMSLSAHKAGGPKGLGVLWIRDGVEIDVPYLGTANTPAITGFGAAIGILQGFSVENRSVLYNTNAKIFFDELNKTGITTIHWCNQCPLVPGTYSLMFKGVDAEELAMCLSTKGVMISTGSACGGSKSHVLKRMGLSEEEINSTVRISFGLLYEKGELIRAAQTVAQVAKELGYGS